MKRALAVMLLLVGLWEGSAAAGEKLYIQSVIANNDSESPAKGARPIGPRLAEKLSPVFRWKYYWELELREIAIPKELQKLKLPSGLWVEVGPIVKGEIEIRLYRGKDLVRKVRYRIQEDEMIIIGGDGEKRSAWFVVVRREKPQYEIARH